MTIKSPFDYWDREGFLEFHQGDVRIYDLEGEKHLFIDQIIYASTLETDWYIQNVLPFAKGSVLEIGLGLGCASKVILSSKKVRKLLTIEKNENVIAAFGQPLWRHMIVKNDIYLWAKEVPKLVPFYDLIFVDHYTMGDPEILPELVELAHNLIPLIKPEGYLIFWIDENAEEADKDFMYKLWYKAPR